MARSHPRPISTSEHVVRERRVSRIAHQLGFVGGIEYRHVYSRAGGARYGFGAAADEDLLIVYAEAFERDADPNEFSLESIIAHERGHQLLARHERLIRSLPPTWSDITEEIVASLVGAILVEDEKDHRDLVLKAMFEATEQGMSIEHATSLITGLLVLLERIL